MNAIYYPKMLYIIQQTHFVIKTHGIHKLLHILAGWLVDCVWNVMTHTQKPDFVFRWNGRAHLNRRGLQFSRLLAAEVCASAVVMLDTPCSEVVWRVLATHSIRQFPLHFPSLASTCPITFHLEPTPLLQYHPENGTEAPKHAAVYVVHVCCITKCICCIICWLEAYEMCAYYEA